MKTSLESRLFLLCIALFLSVEVSFFSAPLRGVAEETEENQEDYACAQTIIDSGGELIEGYENFLDEYFKVDSPTSDQIEEVMDFYRYVENSLNAIYIAAATVNNTGTKSTGFASSELTYCAGIRDQYLAYAQVLLKKNALSSAFSKTTFEVVDGLKVMNEDLEDFSDQFLEVFPGAFNQMNNALPCYARQCISQ